MKRLIQLVFFYILICAYSFAQQLTYSEFIGLAKIEHWSNLNDVLTTKGFQYSGQKNDKAYWTKNCTETEFRYDGSFHWDYKKGTSYSVLEVESDKTTNYKIFTYYFPFKTTYNSFIQAARKNGFEISDDKITDDKITALYIKQKNKNGLIYIEELSFNSRKKDGFFIEYTPTIIVDDVDYTDSNQVIEDYKETSIYVNNTDSECSMEQPQIHWLDSYSFKYCPLAQCSESGTLHVYISVSSDGNVNFAAIIGGTLLNNPRACKTCLSLAKMCRFNVPTGIREDNDGVLTYTIR